jgi:hypothetical protein
MYAIFAGICEYAISVTIYMKFCVINFVPMRTGESLKATLTVSHVMTD